MRSAGATLVLSCLLICALQATYLVESVRLSRYGARATGVVIEDSIGRDTTPVVAWSDRAGLSHRLRIRAGSRLEVGTPVTVIYLEDGTGLARLDSASSLWLPVLLIVPVCALLGGPGLLLLWLSLPKDAPEAEAA